MSQKIISWDIGIKHLAYCIMDYNPNNKNQPFNIYHWGLIDLLEQANDTQINNRICCGTIPKKKNQSVQCSKKPTCYCIINNIEYAFCNVHKKVIYPKLTEESKPLIFIKCNETTNANTNANTHTDTHTDTHTETGKTTNKCQYIQQKTNTLCGKNALWKNENDMSNNYYCSAHKTSIEKTSITKMNLKQIKKTNCTNTSMDLLVEKLVITLDSMPELLYVNNVIIENQLGLVNPKMKTISAYLHTWYMIRGRIEKAKTGSTIDKIQFISPSNKLKVNNDNTIIVLSTSKNAEEKYHLTKNLAVQYCKQLIKQDQHNIELLEKHKKKQDDLCDAFLQGAWFLAIKNNQIDSKNNKNNKKDNVVDELISVIDEDDELISVIDEDAEEEI